jgi:TRAP-type mannitol/chloroaromatic compound transport system substrate-binding protein
MTRMKRRLVLATPAALAAPAVHAQTPLRLRMTTIVPDGTYLFTAFSRRFADLAARVTQNRVVVQPFGAGVLAPPFEVFRAVEDGRADLGHAPPALAYQRDPAMALLTSFPGGLGIEATAHWLDAEGRALLEGHHRDRLGLHPLVAGFATTEIFAHSWKPIRVAADLRGLKFRTLGMWAELLKGFGAEPVATPTAEVAAALERRVIDAAKLAGPADNLQAGLHRIAPYIVIPGAHPPGGYFTVFMQARRWDALDAGIRRDLELAARLTSFDSLVEKGRLDLDAMAEFRKGRAEIITLDPAFVGEIRAAGRAWAAQAVATAKAAGNPWPERIAQSVFAFQDAWERDAVYRL